MLRVLIFCLLSATLLPLGCAAAPERAPTRPAEAPRAGAPVADVAPGDYVIQPLDVLRIEIYREPDLKRDAAKVALDGTLALPLIGTVSLKDKSLRQAEDLIRQLYDKDFLVNPQVNVSVVEYSQRRVEVFGSVTNPGIVLFPREEGLTLMRAISLAGSFTRLANQKAVTIRRTMPDGEVKIIGPINCQDLMKGDASNNTYPLQPGDVINVPERLL